MDKCGSVDAAGEQRTSEQSAKAFRWQVQRMAGTGVRQAGAWRISMGADSAVDLSETHIFNLTPNSLLQAFPER